MADEKVAEVVAEVDEMIPVNVDVDVEVLKALKDDSGMFMYETVLVRQFGLEKQRREAIEKILKELKIDDIEPKHVSDVTLTKMLKDGKMSQETYDKYWELMKPHNDSYFESYKPYCTARNEAINKLEKAETYKEISMIEKEFMDTVRSIINTERTQVVIHECPFCKQTQSNLKDKPE